MMGVMNTQLEAPLEPSHIPKWTLGWRLQRSLAYAGISAGDMGDMLGVSRGTISRWLNDRGAPPRTVYLRHWADACEIPYEWLCHGNLDACDLAPKVGDALSQAGRRGSNFMQSLPWQRIA